MVTAAAASPNPPSPDDLDGSSDEIPGLTLAVFAQNPDVLVQVRRCLPLDVTTVTLTTWSVFLAVAPSCDAAIVRLPPQPSELLVGALGRLHTIAPFVPLVAVAAAAASRALADQLTPVPLAGVVDERDAGAVLWPTVQDACTSTMLDRLAVAVARSPTMPAPLKTALSAAITHTPPIRSVVELVAVTGQNRRTVWYNWRRRTGSSALRLEDLVDWLLLLRASIAHSRGASWTAAAHELGVHRHTLARLAERHLGEPLHEFGPETHTRLRWMFFQKVVRPLLARQH